MSIEKNIYFKHINIYDNAIDLTHALPGQQDCFFRRTSLDDIQVTAEVHPNYDFVIKNTNTNHFFNGGAKIDFSWTSDENFTETQIDEYINLIQNSNILVTKDMVNRILTLVIAETNIQMDEWQGQVIPWVLKSSSTKITMLDSSSEYVCITRFNDHNSYTFSQKTVEDGASANISKLGTEVCYLMVSTEVTTDTSIVLNPIQIYKLTSDNININNNSGSRTRIIRLYK
jgi:hypothetical protein